MANQKKNFQAETMQKSHVPQQKKKERMDGLLLRGTKAQKKTNCNEKHTKCTKNRESVINTSVVVVVHCLWKGTQIVIYFANRKNQ